ncbi:MAG: hypothetical protein WCA78_12550 [Rhizomicrobium sp.]
MSKAVADSIKRGLEQALAYAKGEADTRAYRITSYPPFEGGSKNSSVAKNFSGRGNQQHKRKR